MSHGDNGVTRPRLAHLESILQELSKHEQRSNLQSVEQTSVRMQQRLLKDQLRQAHEELAEAQGGKAKMCETIGALQQVKDEQEKELLLLKTELQASRESQASLIKKVEVLEVSTQILKKNYIRSISLRMKTASDLVNRLQLANTYPVVKADVSGAEIVAKCDEWTESEPNKKKRLMDLDSLEDRQHGQLAKKSTTPAGVDSEREQIQVMEEAEVSAAVNCQVGHGSDKNEEALVLDQDVAMTSSFDIACKENTISEKDSALDTEFLQNEVEEMKSALKLLTGKHEDSERRCAQLMLQSAEAMAEKNSMIKDLEAQLFAARNSAPAEVIPTQSENVADLENRLKVLEDNLSQMNNYADHLESIIGQCPSCSIKIQNEGADDTPSGDA